MKTGLIGIVAVAAIVAAGIASTAQGQVFPQRDPADLNGDGVIDGADLGIMLSKWGPAAPPWAVVLEQCPDPSVVTDEKLRAAILATGLPWRVQDIGTGIEMLLVPPGTFMMGCSASQSFGCFGYESPVREVTLTKAFYLGRYEVTQFQWSSRQPNNPSFFQGQPDSAERPVERVSWNMIQLWLNGTGLQLPSEAQWEYACRAGTTTAFSNGSDNDATLGALAWFDANSASQTRPVGQKLPNALGFHDMHGNVWEWVNDWYDIYPRMAQTDPTGPSSGTRRVLRGGGWSYNSGGCRSSNRASFFPNTVEDQSAVRGFRVMRMP